MSTDLRVTKPATTIEVSTDPDAAKPATTTEVSTDPPAAASTPGRAPSASACEPVSRADRRSIDARSQRDGDLARHLVDDHGFRARYASVRRFIVKLRGHTVPDARVVITTAPAEEAQADYGEGPMVRDPATGKYRRTRLFVLTLGQAPPTSASSGT